MNTVDMAVLIGLIAFISFYGLYKSLKGSKQSSSANEVLHGTNVSILSSALSVCSGFLSAVSLLGFPAEIYYQGTMLYWYGPMYVVSFPLVAFLFLPVFYKLKLTSVYEYLELRFNFGCRFMASITFCIQTLLYISVALYAPALALSAIAAIPLSISVLVTAGLSALYVSVGGAKAGIYTSSLQMALILISMSVIFFISMWGTSFSDVISSARQGGRLQFADFRSDPRIRHSVWSLMIGGTGNILSLFAANQLSIQRYMAMPSLKSAQWVVLLNIPFNFLILTTYVGIGLILYRAYRFCDPIMQARDRLFPYFVVERISAFPGIIGLFLAAIYSAGLSTLSASYSALGAVVIEDVIKQYMQKMYSGMELKSDHAVVLARLLPLVFCTLSIALAYSCSVMETMMLQISLTIFGVAGGPVLSAFCLGIFFPYIKGVAAFIGQLVATLVCFFIAGGAVVSHIRPVGLPLDRSCGFGNTTQFDITDPSYGMVHPLRSDSWLVQVFRVSYQYYSIIALLVAIPLAHIAQLLTRNRTDVPINSDLLCALVVRKQKREECCAVTRTTRPIASASENDPLKIIDSAF
uniref:Sodium-dependent multivitamin transporter n=1 Tax=Parascaris univalens TaxID=6257 RepID=A0A914ZFG2_PARUN